MAARRHLRRPAARKRRPPRLGVAQLGRLVAGRDPLGRGLPHRRVSLRHARSNSVRFSPLASFLEIYRSSAAPNLAGQMKGKSGESSHLLRSVGHRRNQWDLALASKLDSDRKSAFKTRGGSLVFGILVGVAIRGRVEARFWSFSHREMFTQRRCHATLCHLLMMY